MNNLFHLTGTADVGPANGAVLYSATVTPAAAVTTLVLREGGSGGTIILSLQAAANGASMQWTGCKAYSGQLHATLAGSAGLAAIEI